MMMKKNYSNPTPRVPVISKKIVIRRLPPDMVLSTFINQVSPIPPHDYMYFVKADNDYGQFAFSRAYINFIHENDMYLFKEKYDGYVFLDGKGVEYPAVVEFAPFGRTPRRAHRHYKDPKAGTIEDNAYFKNFAKTIENAAPKPVAKDITEIPTHVIMNTVNQNDDKPKKTTPLLTYLSKKKTEGPSTSEEKWKGQLNKKYKENYSYVCFNSNSRNPKHNY